MSATILPNVLWNADFSFLFVKAVFVMKLQMVTCRHLSEDREAMRIHTTASTRPDLDR